MTEAEFAEGFARFRRTLAAHGFVFGDVAQATLFQSFLAQKRQAELLAEQEKMRKALETEQEKMREAVRVEQEKMRAALTGDGAVCSTPVSQGIEDHDLCINCGRPLGDHS